MAFIARKFILCVLISTLGGQTLFHKRVEFENVFCENKMIPHGIKRSSRDCAKMCSLHTLCTGFFFDSENYCFLTEEQLTDANTCSFREGRYYTNPCKFTFLELETYRGKILSP